MLILGIALVAHYLPDKWYEVSLNLYVRSPFYAQAGVLAALVIGLQYVAQTGAAPFVNNPLTSDPVRYARNAAILAEDPTLGLGSPTVAWADTTFRAMHGFRAMTYPSEIRQPILMLAASNDAVVSTSAIEPFGRNLLAGRHLILAGSRHEILQEQDHYRNQFWAAFDAFVPGTPRY